MQEVPFVRYQDYNSDAELLKSVRYQQLKFAISFLKNSPELESPLIWKNYLKKLCQLIVDNSQHHSMTKGISESGPYVTHLRFFEFLTENTHVVSEAKSLLEVYRAYAIASKQSARQIVHQFTANETSFQLRTMAKLLREEYSDLLKMNCLELGAGKGALYDLLKDQVGADYIASDLNISEIALVPTNQKIEYDFNKVCSIKNLDAVISCRSLHLARDKKKTLESIYSSLKPEGSLIFSSGNKMISHNLLHPFELTYAFFPGFAEVGGFLNRPDWESLLDRTGFKVCGRELNCFQGYEYTWIIAAQKIIE